MTKIEWTHAPGYVGESWNPLVGCSIISPGCKNCYAMNQAARIERMTPNSHYAGTTKIVNGNPVWTGLIRGAGAKTLLRPIGQKKPRMYFVNSMSDLFHESVEDHWIDEIFAVMAIASHHRFLVLTKRADRMRDYMTALDSTRLIEAGLDLPRNDRQLIGVGVRPELPLQNVWLGVTAEDQKHADLRIPDLLMTPAAKRFVSYEPAIGRVNFSRIIPKDDGLRAFDAFQGLDHKGVAQVDYGLDWIIAGGESGPDARVSNPEWFRSVRDQCASAGVPYFFKQWGEYMPVLSVEDVAGGPLPNSRLPEGVGSEVAVGRWIMRRVGKKAAGAELDGRQHKEWPE